MICFLIWYLYSSYVTAHWLGHHDNRLTYDNTCQYINITKCIIGLFCSCNFTYKLFYSSVISSLSLLSGSMSLPTICLWVTVIAPTTLIARFVGPTYGVLLGPTGPICVCFLLFWGRLKSSFCMYIYMQVWFSFLYYGYIINLCYIHTTSLRTFCHSAKQGLHIPMKQPWKPKGIGSILMLQTEY